MTEWKEIMVIYLTIALALNAVLSQHKIGEPEVVIVKRHVKKCPAHRTLGLKLQPDARANLLR